VVRDIRPTGPKRSKPDAAGDDDVQELFETTQQPRRQAARQIKDVRSTPAPKRKRRLSGTTVPVAPVSTPAPEQVHSDQDHVEPPPVQVSKRRPEQRNQLPPKTVLTAPVEGRQLRVGHRERIVLLIFLGLTAAVVLIAGLIFLPTAAISLTLKTAPLLVDETVTVTADGGGGEATIPGTAFFRELTINDSVPVETTKVVGAKATGLVVIINTTGQEQPIREQSRLVDPAGHVYYMQRHAIVPPESRANVAVEAAEAGDEYNAPSGERLNFAAFDSGSQSVVYAVTGDAGITGGSGKTISVVGNADEERARTQAGEQAREQAAAEIAGKLERGWSILEESWHTDVTEFNPAHQEGEEAATLPYRARITVRVLGYEQMALEAALKDAVESGLAENFMLFPGPISYVTMVKNVDWEQTRAQLSIRVTHSTIPSLSISTLRDKLAGRSVTEAAQYLEGLPGVERAEIETWPFWVKSVPQIEKRISLDFASDREP